MSMDTIKELIKENRTLVELEKLVYVNYSIANHTGKMETIPSISTSCLCNKRCAARRENSNLICFHCYAAAHTGFKKTLREKLELNTLFYTRYELTKRSVPFIANLFFRFESFGDLINTTQVKNYFTIARYNKQTQFALWTKNPDIIADAIAQGAKKPGNLSIICSIPEMDKSFTIENFKKLKKQYPFIDRVFLVYSNEYIDANNIAINCGGKSCSDCGYTCYTKSNRTRIIREKLK